MGKFPNFQTGAKEGISGKNGKNIFRYFPFSHSFAGGLFPGLAMAQAMAIMKNIFLCSIVENISLHGLGNAIEIISWKADGPPDGRLKMITLATTTFEPDAEQPEFNAKYGWASGTAEVTFQGQTRRVDVRKTGETEWVIFGIGGRYPTGSKVWPASIQFNHATNKMWVSLGFDSRSGRHGQPSLTGFLEQAGKNNISKR